MLRKVEGLKPWPCKDIQVIHEEEGKEKKKENYVKIQNFYIPEIKVFYKKLFFFF